MSICCVAKCCMSSAKTVGITWHVVPKDKDTRNEWAVLLGVTPFGRNRKICSLHFTSDAFRFTDGAISRIQGTLPTLNILSASPVDRASVGAAAVLLCSYVIGENDDVVPYLTEDAAAVKSNPPFTTYQRKASVKRMVNADIQCRRSRLG